MRVRLLLLAFVVLSCLYAFLVFTEAPGFPTTSTLAALAKPSLPQPPKELSSKVKMELFTNGLSQPVGMAVAPGDTAGRLFFIEKTGTLRIVRNGKPDEKPFLDLTKDVSAGGEQGLLGLAFHTDYATNGRFFVNYTDKAGDTQVVEFRVSKTDPNVADPESHRPILSVKQPYSNHNGGNIVMGPDRLLYVGMGDGGSANDPENRAQNDATLLGKMLRIDVDAKEPKPEVAAKGLRNPWRFSFDRQTQDLYIGDVGQNRFEWVHFVPKGQLKGKNFGWKILEGNHCLEGQTCDRTGLELPEIEYPHADGCCITGGVVYRGKKIPELQGHYFYADYCTDLIRSFRMQDGKAVDQYDWAPLWNQKPARRLILASAFGEDADGEVYLISLSGAVYRIERQ